MKNKIFAIVTICFILLQTNSFAQEHWPNIGPGINLDYTTTEVNKVGYDPGFHEAFQHAGFESIRLFVKPGHKPEEYKQAVDDALERGLTVVIVMFPAKFYGKEVFVEFWREYAEYFQMYPKELVFELMNEPEMAGFPSAEILKNVRGKHDWTEAQIKEVMDWMGAAIVAVREISPTRVLAVGGVGYNNVRYLHTVSAKYLDYKLPDGSGFDDDENIWGVFHLYVPPRWAHSSKYTLLDDANPKWKEEVIENLDKVVKWTKNQNKKVLLTEWGTRMYNDHKDIERFIEFFVAETKKRNIDWMYFCGVFNNAWPFSLYSTEKGWDECVPLVEQLTGVTPTLVPPTNQINNSSIDMDIDHWYSTEQVTIGTADGQGVNGSRAMRCMVAFIKPNDPAIWQQSPPSWKWRQVGGMLQLRQGNTYTISLYAKTPVNKTKLSVQLGVAPSNEKVLYTSEQVEINTGLTKYEFTYKHEAETVDDARFSIIFTQRHSEIILDNIKLRGTRPDYKPTK